MHLQQTRLQQVTVVVVEVQGLAFAWVEFVLLTLAEAWVVGRCRCMPPQAKPECLLNVNELTVLHWAPSQRFAPEG